MEVAFLVISGIMFVTLTLVLSLKIPSSAISEFELKRRKELGDSAAIFGLKRLEARNRLLALKQIISFFLIASLGWLLVAAEQWVGGILLTIGVLFVTLFLARFGLVRRISQRLYRKVERWLIEKTRPIESLLTLMAVSTDDVSHHGFQSSEELQHVLRQSSAVLGHEETELLIRSMYFYDRRVDGIMTPVKSIETIEASEVLGPLVIDRLHKTGHTQFPVTNGDEVVGLVDITDSMKLKRRESPEAREVMRYDMVRVSADETLDTVLKIFIDVKQPSLLVIDEHGDVIGLVSIGDVVRALTGWKYRSY